MKHALLSLIALSVFAQPPELESLRRRVEQLEQQNRQMLELIRQMQARLDAAAAPAAPKPAAAKAEPVLWPEVLDASSRIKLYGFLRLDMDLDSQRPNNSQTPLFVTPGEPAVRDGAGDFSMHPRLTRLGLDFTGPRLNGMRDARLSGKLEIDFENGGSESRQLIRIRHAYLKSNWGGLSLLAGQTWDLFSPLFPTVNNDTLMWNAGNIGDRRPQLRLGYEPRAGRGQWSFSGGIGLSGAVDPVDLDQNGYRDGEQSSRPNLQSRIGYSRPLWGDQPFIIGASAYYGWLQSTRPLGGRTQFCSQAANFDYVLPLHQRASLRGEAWWGRNMSDVRGGAGQGLNLADGREIRGRGGWSELKLSLTRAWSLHPGFTTDDPVDADLARGGRVRNRAFYFANRFTPGAKVEIGFDYLRWRTDYKGLPRGIDNRLNVFFQYGF